MVPKDVPMSGDRSLSFFLFVFFLFVRGACVTEPLLPTVGIAKRGIAM